ncbi:hypothetical protein Tco_0139884 [Tanacetum coccineum]
MESKAKEDKYLDEIIELEKKKKALDNVVYKMAQRKVPTLYCGNTIVKQHASLSVIDTEKTFELDEESILKMQTKQNDPIFQEKKINIAPIDYVALNKLSAHFVKHFLLLSQDLVHTTVNSLTEIIDYQTMEKNFLDEYSECVELKAELSKKNEMVEKAVYDELSKRFDRLENRCISLEIKMQQNKESFQNNQPQNTQEFLVYVSATCPSSIKPSEKQIAVTPRNTNKKVRSKSVKSKKKNVWKLTGKVFTNVGYSWKPTGRMFTINGSTCPLTRINSTIVVPPREPTSTKVVKKSQPSSNNSGKLKDITDIGLSSKSKSLSILGRSNHPLVYGMGLLQAHDRDPPLAIIKAFQDNLSRKVFKITISHSRQDKGTRSSLKSMITTSNHKLMIEVKDYELKTKVEA